MKNILLGITWGICCGAYLVVLPFYDKKIFEMSEEGIAIIYVTQGFGVLLGCLISSEVKIKTERSRRLTFFICYLLQAICFILFTYSTSIIIASASLLSMRLFSRVIASLDNTLIQMNTATNTTGQILSFHYSIYRLVMQFSIFPSGIFISKIGLFQFYFDHRLGKFGSCGFNCISDIDT